MEVGAVAGRVDWHTVPEFLGWATDLAQKMFDKYSARRNMISCVGEVALCWLTQIIMIDFDLVLILTSSYPILCFCLCSKSFCLTVFSPLTEADPKIENRFYNLNRQRSFSPRVCIHTSHHPARLPASVFMFLCDAMCASMFIQMWMCGCLESYE